MGEMSGERKSERARAAAGRTILLSKWGIIRGKSTWAQKQTGKQLLGFAAAQICLSVNPLL